MHSLASVPRKLGLYALIGSIISFGSIAIDSLSRGQCKHPTFFVGWPMWCTTTHGYVAFAFDPTVRAPSLIVQSIDDPNDPDARRQPSALITGDPSWPEDRMVPSKMLPGWARVYVNTNEDVHARIEGVGWPWISATRTAIHPARQSQYTLLGAEWRPYWPGLLRSVLACSLLAVVITRLYRMVVRARRRQKGKCPECAYDIGTSFAGRCPECGALAAGGTGIGRYHRIDCLPCHRDRL